MTRAKTINFAFLMSTCISGLLALLVIGLPLIAHAFDPAYEMPSVIDKWGGVVIGYYFGSMTTIFLKFFDAKNDEGKAGDGA